MKNKTNAVSFIEFFTDSYKSITEDTLVLQVLM